MTRLVMVSNRVPDIASREVHAGGLAVALHNALKAHGGLWFGWNGQVKTPSPDPLQPTRSGNVEFATLPLSRQEYRDYYLGYANKVLWPVLHLHANAVDYQREYAAAYRQVNQRFAAALLPLLEADDSVWVHDYHFIPLAAELRAHRVRQRLGFFLHTPFPGYNQIRALPGYRDRLAELCQYDLLGFQTRDDRHDFEETIAETFGSDSVVQDGVRYNGRFVKTGVYPVGIDVGEAVDLAQRAIDSSTVRSLTGSLGNYCDIVAGVDRLDYSKGLPNRARAFETLLRDYPHRRSHTVYMQVASPSRSAIYEYGKLRRELEHLYGHINGTYGEFGWVPVHYLNQTFTRACVMGLYRVAHVGLVTPLRDGMNLVAKEFIAAQDPAFPGVLVLSELAGAARELDAAILVNPYDVDAIAAGINTAIAMPLAERRRRHETMLDTLRHNSIQNWYRRYLRDLNA